MILHLTPAAAWAAAGNTGVYTADSLPSEGFIHCSEPGQALWVANTRFRGRTDLLLLHIDPARLTAPVRYENLEGGAEQFPHIYGPLNVDAVVGADPFPCMDDGCFDADRLALLNAAHAIAAAIGRRDVKALQAFLTAEFMHHGEGGTRSDGAAFLEGVRAIPGEILFVRLDRVDVERARDAAMLTGTQHAQVRVEGNTIDDRRGFADLFVKVGGAWRLRAAADFPLPG